MKSLTRLAPLVLIAGWILTVAKADDPAGKLLDQVESKTRSLHSFKFQATDARTFNFTEPEKHKGYPHQSLSTVDLTFLRPNLFIGDLHESNYPGTFHYSSDGTSQYFVNKGTYQRSPIDPTAESFSWFHDDLVLFYVTGSLKKAIDPPYPPKLRLLADEEWNGETYRVIGVHVGGGLPIDYKLYVGNDLLLHRITHEEKDADRDMLLDFSVKDATIDPALTASDFAFHAGPDLKEEPKTDYYKDNPLISVGATATDFSLPTPAGPRLSLKAALAGHKAVLLNFWFVGCPPCRAEHPKLQKFFSELKGKGLGLVSVDDQDTAEGVAKYLKDAHLSFPTVLTGPMVGIDPKTGERNYRGPKLPDYASLTPYGVHECPTNILIDANFRVVYVSNEWNEQALREALGQLGVR